MVTPTESQDTAAVALVDVPVRRGRLLTGEFLETASAGVVTRRAAEVAELEIAAG